MNVKWKSLLSLSLSLNEISSLRRFTFFYVFFTFSLSLSLLQYEKMKNGWSEQYIRCLRWFYEILWKSLLSLSLNWNLTSSNFFEFFEAWPFWEKVVRFRSRVSLSALFAAAPKKKIIREREFSKNVEKERIREWDPLWAAYQEIGLHHNVRRNISNRLWRWSTTGRRSRSRSRSSSNPNERFGRKISTSRHRYIHSIHTNLLENGIGIKI